MKTARRPLGPVMIDLSGCELSRDEQRWLTHPNMGGVILFARNFRDRAQLAALTVQIRSIRHDALIAVDHEGGRVQRFRSDGFTHLPAMRRLGECWDDDAPLAACAATAAGYILASELRASGIDFSFTPVLDLDYGRSTAIGDRAFHANPAIVAALAKQLCHGLALAGMANCGKHFPGHGFVEADSHHAMPVDARALDPLLHDAQPYVWVDLALVAVMPAHVVYSAVDAWPAGFSKIWLRDILRRRLGFSGAILSDDLSMESARAMGDIVESAQAVLDAGCDMALVCNCPDQTQQVLDRVRHALSSDSSARLRSLAARGAALSWDALTRQPRYQAARALLNRLLRIFQRPALCRFALAKVAISPKNALRMSLCFPDQSSQKRCSRTFCRWTGGKLRVWLVFRRFQERCTRLAKVCATGRKRCAFKAALNQGFNASQLFILRRAAQ